MRPHLFLAILVLAAPAARADDQAAKTIEQQKAEMKHDAEAEALQLKPIQADRITEVLQFTVQASDLAVRTTLPTTEGFARLQVPGLGGFPKVQINAAGTQSVQFNQLEFPPNGEVIITTIFAMPQYLQVSRDQDGGYEHASVQLIQSDQYAAEAGTGGEGKVKLYINVSRKITGEVSKDLKLSAASILELRRKYPAEIAQYVEPIFRDLQQESVLAQVDPRLAWQVFAPFFTPDPQLEKSVQSLAKQLDAEAFTEREAASKELEKLGAPAAIVLMRLDRTRMSDEQQTRIDALAAPYKPLPDDEIARLRGDPFFLLDCLYCDDIQIRQWALAGLQKSAAIPIAFDPTAPRQERDQTISALRKSLLAPATQPATAPTTSQTAR